MKDKNLFGGGNPNAVYTPMSEDEQEVLSRLVAEDDFHVHVVGWGWVHRPKVSFGDLRVMVPVSITFSAPETPQPVYAFQLELWAKGILLFSKTYPVSDPGGSPLMVYAGFQLAFAWDIAIRSMDPKLVRALKPGANGLTSRWTDKDTGAATLFGNTKLSPEQRRELLRLRQGERMVAKNDEKAIAKALRKASGKGEDG